ncbi:class I SAM-dependent methyltransferase [Pseudoalteromonas sp. SSDWG2]|uniref:class I SAM-dependent methyltransferase n=1 Tax=Pseudoalteromonas sp. SSDWG2 TaxID=3139391 RepID=UPI003BA9B8FA
MPTFTGDEAIHYDSRIQRLVPGYELLHQLTRAQCQVQLKADAKVLVVGAGTGKEVLELAKENPQMQFVAQDISRDMLDIAQQRFNEAGVHSRVKCHLGSLEGLEGAFDGAICLLVMHFIADDGGKAQLLKHIRAHLHNNAWLWIADLMKPETQFERDAQFVVCQQLGLTDIGVERTRQSFATSFFALDRMRFAQLLDDSGFSVAHCYFKALSFAGYAISCE